MDIEVLSNPPQSLVDFLENKIDKFNLEHWEVKERHPLAVQLKDAQGNIIAGAAARSFGKWLLLDNLWVDDSLRGKNVGSKVLQKIEEAGKLRSCEMCLLDTLNFQAMPFYRKHGYEVQWVQENYPESGCKYFMTKAL
ncbi:GNAT family N-acetyltransferase [Veronia nyctiphanis]|uniref:GNAT family N-acetyltransferase n=1 Tax=Veronia nyctiphanis TaxID=1278244 RepID=A0A4Q0YP63_9GAMM|nr:GNAT family N-acetyltransferase [Veronia nyctiphanis]RXJ72800.1 GNAT family N-acetyltransferase [Veronia nyctiphanis]